MKVVQKILSHGLLITFFVAVFFLYLYRAALFPQWFGERAETGAASTFVSPHEKQQQHDPSITSDNATVVPPASAPPTVQATSTDDSGLPPLVVDDEPVASDGHLPPLVADDEPSPDSSLPPVVADESAAVQEVAQGRAVTEPAHEAPADERQTGAALQADPTPLPVGEHRPPAAHAPVAESQLTIPAESTGPAQAGEGELASSGEQYAVVPDYQSQLLVARELYWKRDADGAVSAYTQLLQSHPDRADGWGELGNLYMALDQKDNAANAYSRAIGLFMEQGRWEDARGMLGVIRSLDPAKEAELRQWLEQAER